MKAFFFLIGVCVACALGYMTEPALRPIIHKIAGDPAAKEGKDEQDPAEEFDYASIPEDQLPAEVTVLKEFTFKDPNSGIAISIVNGTDVILNKVVGKTAFVTPKNTEYEISLPASHTDLAKRVTTESAAEPEKAPAAPVASIPAPEVPAPDPAVPPSEIAALNSTDPKPEAATPPSPPEPAVAPQPEPAVPQPEPSTPEPAASASSADVVAIMKKSLELEEIKEFNTSEVKEWNAGEPETVDGTSFSTGTVVYEKNTIFGLKRITAKAFIQDGKVARWVWPKSGLVIQ